MKLIFKQRRFSWFDKYDVFDEKGKTIYTVKGQMAWGHCLKIYNSDQQELGTIKEKVISLYPSFQIYVHGHFIGKVQKEFSFFKPKFKVDFNGWKVKGNWVEWDYNIFDKKDNLIANITKDLLNVTDTYLLEIEKPSDALCVLMLVIAIDAEKESRDD